MSDELEHYGMPRRSGRYPWGSGGTPQRSISFRGTVNELRKQGLSDVEIAKSMEMKTTQLRAKLSLDRMQERASKTAEAVRLKDKGCSPSEIGRRMNLNESSVRSLLDPILAQRSSVSEVTAQVLKESVDKNRYVDIGPGVAQHLGVSDSRLTTAVALLQEQGYKVHKVNVDQIGIPGQFTTVKALGAPDTEWKTVVKDPSLIQPIGVHTGDFGRTYDRTGIFDASKIQHISPSRVDIKYAEDGGSLKDGVIELRRGVSDLDLGAAHYAQVRIAVGGTHFAKGMAMYNDKMPDGKDIVFNTNKTKSTPMMGPKDNTVLKPLKDDPDNPFGSAIKPFGQRGALNVVNEEGDWEKWSRTLSSQMLSKQTESLAQKQLSLALKQKQDEYDEISALTNPIVKRKLLQTFADDADSSAVHLKAAALPRQASKVILPVPGIKEHEIYAPSFRPGESVVLIRHPHGGRFEIPQLVVNNSSRTAKSVMGNSLDAVGIHPNVAKKLSGADFDGDSVIVIPNTRGLIKTAASLKGLENFDPIELYRIPSGSSIPKIKPDVKQRKMGEISNLITDMTIKGAPTSEVVRAVRHSMVVIDSEKHDLDYRQSYIDHGIASLSTRYQKGPQGGASTLISRSKSPKSVDERKPRSMKEGGPIDPKTGEKIYTPTSRTYPLVKYRDPITGKLKETTPRRAEQMGYTVISTKIVTRQTKSRQMEETKDARTLSSGRPVEETYADYANQMKGLANAARRDTVAIRARPSSPSAKITYATEAADLKSKLNLALRNAPLERQAQILANATIRRKKEAYPDMDQDDLKKVRNQALAEARDKTGAGKEVIKITDREWEAIQAGAVSSSKLAQILDNADMERVKQLATPRSKPVLSATKLNRAKLLMDHNASLSEAADALGISTKELTNALYAERSN